MGVFSLLGFSSSGAHGGVLREVTTYTGGCTPGWVKVMVASLSMLALAGTTGEVDGAGSGGELRASGRVGSLACRGNGGRRSRLLVMGSAFGGISSVVEDGRLLPVHRERRRRRLGRERMVIGGERRARWSHRAIHVNGADVPTLTSQRGHAMQKWQPRGDCLTCCSQHSGQERGRLLRLWEIGGACWQGLDCSFPVCGVCIQLLTVKENKPNQLS